MKIISIILFWTQSIYTGPLIFFENYRLALLCCHKLSACVLLSDDIPVRGNTHYDLGSLNSDNGQMDTDDPLENGYGFSEQVVSRKVAAGPAGNVYPGTAP